MSGLGTIIIISVTVGVTYFGMGQFGLGKSSGPVPMTPEVKTYVDSKIGITSGNAAQELQKILSRVAEMETKIIEMDKIRANYEQLPEKSELIESAIGEQRKSKEDILVATRTAELAQLRNDIATLCAGVTVKRGTPLPGARSSNPIPGVRKRGQGQERRTGDGGPVRGGSPGDQRP